MAGNFVRGLSLRLSSYAFDFALYFSQVSDVFEHLNPVVVTVSNVDFIIVANCDARRQAKFATIRSAFSDGQQQTPLKVENLEIVEQRIGDIHMAKAIHRQTFGSSETAGSVAVAAELGKKPALRIKHLHPAVHGIGYQQALAAISRDVSRKIKFAWSYSSSPKFRTQRPIQPEDKHGMRLGIHHGQTAHFFKVAKSK
jgi:hypothetical protein